MDKHNLFYTRPTYNLVRLDYAVFMIGAAALVAVHWRDVHWWRFTWAFLWPDLVGTFPGMYWYYARRNGSRRSIPTIFHSLYNFGHSFVVNATLVLIWHQLAGGWEWAMLSLPIHLTGDRAIFGNIYKPFGLSFEPVTHAAFARFQEEYERSGRW